MSTVSEPVLAITGHFRWQLPSQYRDALLSERGLRLQEWLRDGRARIVKHGPHRTVYQVTLPGLDFYLKHYRVCGTRAWLRQWLRPGKARTEYARALTVAERGVPTVVPVGFGERYSLAGSGESYLLTATLPDAEPLDRFLDAVLPTLPRTRQVRIRLDLPRALARLLARMHGSGITHHDLHAGNILVRVAADGAPELFLIDLHAVSLGGPLDWARARANLVMLNRWFIVRAERGERLRFWKEYQRLCQPMLPPSLPTLSPPLRGRVGVGGKGLARDLERQTWQSNLAFWRRRDRRCLESNRYYQPVGTASLRGHAVHDLDSEDLATILRSPDQVFDRPGVSILKDSRSSTVAELSVSVGDRVRPAIFKRFRVNRWLSLLRRPAALRSWIHGQGLRERALPTPRTLLVLQRRQWGLWRQGYLLTEKVPEALDLRTFVDRLATMPAVKRRVLVRGHIEQLARLVRELHRHGLSHRDLKAANILMSPQRCPWSLLPRPVPPLAHEPWLIDLVGVTLHRRLSQERKVQNLSRLHASFCQHPLFTRTDKLRFLRIYLQWGLAGRHSWKEWWRAVEAATRAKIEKNRRNGRPLA